MDLTKKLTLVMNTKDRDEFLHHSLSYYSNIGFNGTIIVCDASSQSILKKNELFIKKIKSLRIKHLKVKKKQVSSIFESLDLIDTDYVGVATDDDLYTYDGLNLCLEKLEINKQVKSAWGQIAKITIKGNSPTFFKNISRYQFYNLNIYNSLLKMPPSERYLLYMKKPYDFVWAIRRRDDFKSIFKLANQFNSERWASFVYNSYCAIYQPPSLINEIFLIRQNHSKRDMNRERTDFLSFLEEKDFNINLHRFRNKMADLLAEKEKNKYKNSKSIIDSGISYYFSDKLIIINNRLRNKFKNENNLYLIAKRIINKLRRIIDKLINYKLYKKLYKNIIYISRNFP
ncbi:MAG: hypothetical protein CMG62_10080 [Candidatus Marinimicrobia bacterium]|nr:hypothetical protein [Candidatus Neomarinimicrobiota bacterium]|tara:strand:- start:4708 stop:5736 length:1029 start_codon:yes stop_codon:yes gene_type:complete